MKYLAFHQDKEYYYVVTEKLELELHQLLRRRRFFLPEQTRELVRPILSAIDYLHDMDVCHRDVKLENCLLKNADDLSSVKVGGVGGSRRHDHHGHDGHGRHHDRHHHQAHCHHYHHRRRRRRY